MPITEPLQPSATWIQVTATAEDWDAADPALLQTLAVQMHLIRAFEEQVLDLAGQKLINGPAHSSIGHETLAAAAEGCGADEARWVMPSPCSTGSPSPWRTCRSG